MGIKLVVELESCGRVVRHDGGGDDEHLCAGVVLFEDPFLALVQVGELGDADAFLAAKVQGGSVAIRQAAGVGIERGGMTAMADNAAGDVGPPAGMLGTGAGPVGED